jgi:hypothetical protein
MKALSLLLVVLGVNPTDTNNNDYDYDVLKKYWSDWLYEMGLEEDNFEFKMAGSPANMDKVIKRLSKINRVLTDEKMSFYKLMYYINKLFYYNK